MKDMAQAIKETETGAKWLTVYGMEDWADHHKSDPTAKKVKQAYKDADKALRNTPAESRDFWADALFMANGILESR